MAALLEFLVMAFGRFITSKWVIAIAAKGFAFLLFSTVLPTILVTVFQKVLKYTLEYASQYVGSSGSSSITIQLTQLGGYLANEVALSSCFAIIISALALRAVLNMISPRL